jgi:uncharacterized protein (DUF2164 family)
MGDGRQGRMAVQLTKEAEKRLLGTIRRFAKDELEVDIGELKASFILDFFLRELAPTVYDQAIEDARRYLQEKADDLPGVLHATGPSAR